MMNQKIWQKADQNNLNLSDIIIRALVRSGTVITLQDTDLEFLFIANIPYPWKFEALEPPSDTSLFGMEIATRLAELKKNTLLSGQIGRMEASDGGEATYQFVVEMVSMTDERKAVITTIIDLTEERRREAVLKSLLREVSHRSKNMLAIVQSMANQTARAAGSLDQFIKIFRGRIQSLSFSQDLVTAESWRGADLFTLIEKQTSLYLGEGVRGIQVTGENIHLTPNGVTHVGLAIHELTLNAAARGTLDGNISYPVKLEVERKRTGNITLRWTEGLPLANSAQGHETGEIDLDSVLLKRVVPQSLDGKVVYEIKEVKLVYELNFDSSR